MSKLKWYELDFSEFRNKLTLLNSVYTKLKREKKLGNMKLIKVFTIEGKGPIRFEEEFEKFISDNEKIYDNKDRFIGYRKCYIPMDDHDLPLRRLGVEICAYTNVSKYRPRNYVIFKRGEKERMIRCIHPVLATMKYDPTTNTFYEVEYSEEDVKKVEIKQEEYYFVIRSFVEMLVENGILDTLKGSYEYPSSIPMDASVRHQLTMALIEIAPEATIPLLLEVIKLFAVVGDVNAIDKIIEILTVYISYFNRGDIDKLFEILDIDKIFRTDYTISLELLYPLYYNNLFFTDSEVISLFNELIKTVYNIGVKNLERIIPNILNYVNSIARSALLMSPYYSTLLKNSIVVKYWPYVYNSDKANILKICGDIPDKIINETLFGEYLYEIKCNLITNPFVNFSNEILNKIIDSNDSNLIECLIMRPCILDRDTIVRIFNTRKVRLIKKLFYYTIEMPEDLIVGMYNRFSKRIGEGGNKVHIYTELLEKLIMDQRVPEELILDALDRGYVSPIIVANHRYDLSDRVLIKLSEIGDLEVFEKIVERDQQIPDEVYKNILSYIDSIISKKGKISVLLTDKRLILSSIASRKYKIPKFVMEYIIDMGDDLAINTLSKYRYQLPEDIIEKIVESNISSAVINILRSGQKISHKVLLKIIDLYKDNSSVLENVAMIDQDLPEDVIRLLLETGYENVKEEIACRKYRLPDSVILELVKDKSISVVCSLLSNRSQPIPDYIIDKLLKSNSVPIIQSLIAGNRKMTGEVIRNIYERFKNKYRIKVALAKNDIDIPYDILKKLATDKNSLVREAVALRESPLPESIIRILINDLDDKVVERVASRKQPLSDYVIEELSRKRNIHILASLLKREQKIPFNIVLNILPRLIARGSIDNIAEIVYIIVTNPYIEIPKDIAVKLFLSRLTYIYDMKFLKKHIGNLSSNDIIKLIRFYLAKYSVQIVFTHKNLKVILDNIKDVSIPLLKVLLYIAEKNNFSDINLYINKLVRKISQS